MGRRAMMPGMIPGFAMAEATPPSRSERRPARPARGTPRPTGMAWMVVALGAVALGFGLWGLKLGLETLSWPRVEAQIVDKRLTVRDDTPSRSSSSDAVFGSHARSEFAAFAVLFRYDFAGRSHLAGGVERGDLGLQNSAKSRELDETHPVGKRVTVVVDPRDPDDAYLVAGPSSAAKMLTGVGAVMVLIGLWMRSLMRRGIGSVAGADEDA